MRSLARALITAVAFLDLADDDVMDPDAAEAVLEEVGNDLARCGPDEVAALRRTLAQMRARERLNDARPELLEFYDTFLSAFGLEEDDGEKAVH